MISQEQVDRIRELLKTGQYSQREISRITDVSRAVIQRIASGKRKDHVERPKEDWDEDRRGRPFERCPICGVKTQLPCLACVIRQFVAKNKPPRFPEPAAPSFELQLEERHRRRYEQVKTWRESQKDPCFTEIPEDWPFRKRCRLKQDDVKEEITTQ